MSEETVQVSREELEGHIHAKVVAIPVLEALKSDINKGFYIDKGLAERRIREINDALATINGMLEE